MMKRETLSVADIYVPIKRRTTIDQKRVDAIAASMLDSGQQTPIHADFLILHGTLTDARNLPENIEVMARPKRFELRTPSFVVWCLLGASESHPKPAHQPPDFYATGAE